MRGRTCGTCASHWRAREARWCGRCGAPLQAGAQDRPRVRLRRPGLAGAGLLAAVALVGVTIGPSPRQHDPPGDRHVVLPARPGDPVRSLVPSRTEVRCRSSSYCTQIETASAHRGPFLGAATDGLLVLAEGPGVSAYELTSGRRRWHLDLEMNPMRPVPRVAAVEGEQAVAIAVPAGDVVAIDTRDGRIRWRKPAPGIEDVFAVRSDTPSWQATVRTREDNTSRITVVSLPPAPTPRPVPIAGNEAHPDAAPRCCDDLVADAARDGLDLRRIDGVPGGLIRVLHADTGRHVADLSLATYHGQRVATGRWLFVAPHRAVVVTGPTP